MKPKRTAALLTAAALVILASAVAAFAITSTAGPDASRVAPIRASLSEENAAPAAATPETGSAPADGSGEQQAPSAGEPRPSESFSGNAEDASSLNGVTGDSHETVRPPVRDEDDDTDSGKSSDGESTQTPTPGQNGDNHK